MPGLGKKVIMIKSEMELDGEIKGLDSRYGKLCLYFLKIEYLRRQIFLKFYNLLWIPFIAKDSKVQKAI